jgi:hypothetical protein
MGMPSTPPIFGDVLDAVASLSVEDQVALVDIVQHRLAAQGHERVVADVQEARRDFVEGRCQTVTIKQLKDAISS